MTAEALIMKAFMTAIPWDMAALTVAPRVFEAPLSGAEGIRALFYEGLSWKGRGTRVFAYCGIPERASSGRVPGMVLVHGGGGSAFIPWVQLWMRRGYAAIAMDTCGCVSGGGYENHLRHEHGGPPGWGGFEQINEPVNDQWTHHAVADVVLAHSLLSSFQKVDPARIGLTGVSWGGYLACIAAAVDGRFRFAAPVYGCGFLGENSAWLNEFRKMGEERARRWLAQWDPSVYLPGVRMPMLWVNGTNDFAYPPDSWLMSSRLPSGDRTLCLRVRMPHGHGGPGENPPEIHVLAEALFRNGVPLPRILSSGRDGQHLRVTFESQVPPVRAELNYTTDAGPWQERNWQTESAALEAAGGAASATMPVNATAVYLNLVDHRGCVVSSDCAERMIKNESQAKRS